MREGKTARLIEEGASALVQQADDLARQQVCHYGQRGYELHPLAGGSELSAPVTLKPGKAAVPSI